MRTNIKQRTKYPRLEMPKRCAACEQVKPSSDFHANRNSTDGLNWYCRPCTREKDSQPKNRFSSSRAAIRAEGVPFDLTFEQWHSLIQKPCDYCLGELPKTGRGVDRIDPEVGYVFDNLVPCCGACNTMKGRFITRDEFRRHFGPSVKALKAERIAKGLDPLTMRTAPNQHDRPTRRQLRAERAQEKLKLSRSSLA